MLTPETNLGSYRLIERIGAGGMGEVWKAEDSRLGRIVAIKILPPSVTANAEATARLRREARMAAQLNHPNIATIHSIEEAGDRLFIVMEFVDGEPLSKVIRRGISEADLCRVGRSVAEALAEAHAKGIVHRDIKPDNVIVAGSRVKVLDFGIAKQVETSSSSDAPTAPFLTQQGMILGTIHYMSPEQALGKTLDARTDIFSLGVVLYEAATRRLPFQGETITETMTQIIRDEPPEPTQINASISPGLNAIIQRCMRKNREERFATAGDLARALEEQLGRASTARFTAPPAMITALRAKPKRRVWPWAAALVILGGLGAVFAIQHRLAAGAPPAAERPRTAAPTQTVAPPPPAATSVTVPAPKIEEAPKKPAETTSADGLKPAAPREVEVAPSADRLYERGMALLSSGDRKTAQQTFHEAIKTDPHYARAHMRLGDIALARRDFDPAGRQFEAALNDADRLTPREQELTRLGQAIAARNREQASEIARGIMERWPNDPELLRLHREFPGMFMAPGERHLRRRGRGL